MAAKSNWCTAEPCPCPPLTHFFPLAVCSSGHHQVVLNVLATVFAGAVKVEMLLQLPLAVSRHLEGVHVADGQLLALWDFPQSSQLDPGHTRGQDGVWFPESNDTCFVVPFCTVWMQQIPILCQCMSACTIKTMG